MPKKQQNRGPKPKAIKAIKPLDAPVFLYLSVCCSLKATKPALLKTADAEGTLGSWHCTGCGKSAKVTRIKNEKPAPEITQEVA